MGKQYNKVIKRKRRQSYVVRKVAAQAAAVKAKTVARPARAKAEPRAAKPKAAAPSAAVTGVPASTEEHPAASAE